MASRTTSWAGSSGYSPSGRVRLNLEGLGIIRARLSGAIDTALLQTAIKIRDDAKDKAPKDTGFLAESIHIATADGSEYEAAKQSAEYRYDDAIREGKTPKGVRISKTWGKYAFFPEVRPENPHEIFIVVGAQHGIANEEAVHGRKPFLTPSVYQNRGTLTAQIRVAFDGLSVKAVLTKGG